TVAASVPQGPPGSPGPTGPPGPSGLSKAFSIVGTDLHLQTSDTPLASEVVPAGSYVVLATVVLENFDSAPQTATCSLSSGFSAQIRLGEFGTIVDGPAQRTTATLHDIVAFGSDNSTIILTCRGFNIGAFSIRLTAIKVDSIE